MMHRTAGTYPCGHHRHARDRETHEHGPDRSGTAWRHARGTREPRRRTAGVSSRARVVLVLVCALLPLVGFSQDADSEVPDASPEQNSEEAARASLLEQWRETLRYGIDSEIPPVLEQIRQSGSTGLNDEIADRFTETRDTTLRREIVEHFTELESDALAVPVRELLLGEDIRDNELLRAMSAYVSRVVEDDSPELLERYAQIARDGDLLAASVAVDAIGRNGSPAAVALLLDLYGEIFDTDLRAAILRALGETESEEAVPLLTGIARDEFAESSLRQYATESLGRIGSPESLPLLEELLGADDSLLRAYATAALGFYETEETGETLEDALRDSFWRVRVAALEALAEQGTAEALPAIAYKAERDPEQPVREAAIRTLGTLGGAEAYEVLREIAATERLPQTSRILAIEELAESDPAASRETLANVVRDEWEREGSRLLDAVGRFTSAHPTPDLAPIYVKLLEHPNFIIRLYGIRGIGGAGLSSHSEQLKQIARDNPPGLARRTAVEALAEMGITYDPEADQPDEAPGNGEAPSDADPSAAEDTDSAPEQSDEW